MAELVFSEVGAAVGSAVLPEGLSVLGREISGAALGRSLGSLAGRAVDNALAAPREVGRRLTDLHVLDSREGAGQPRVFGRARIGGQVIWATKFRERSETRSTGGKGGPRVRSYRYSISFAVGLGEGVVRRVGTIWANGQPLDLSGINWRFYPGTEDQVPDALIEAVEGVAPAFRGTAYVVFEDLDLTPFGNRLPQLSFEVFRSSGDDRAAFSDRIRGVNIIPSSGEFAYGTETVSRIYFPGHETPENRNTHSGQTDFLTSLDQLEADVPNARSVALTVAWFGDDLRLGACTIRPRVDDKEKQTLPEVWSVGPVNRGTALATSRDFAGQAAYGGTPSDASVMAAIREMVARGLAVTYSPFLLMDVPPGNGLPDPQGGTEQAAFPWRGRITCYPASSDGSASAEAQMAAFFGTARASDFSIEGDQVSYDGPEEWSFRRFILHQAALAKAAGGVDAFLLGSEMVGVTRVRGADGSFPGVAGLRALLAEVRALLGSGVKIGYGADWTEYGAYGTGDGDVLFPLDPLWSDPALDFVGVDWYPPLGDWREGSDHLDAAVWKGPDDPAYLRHQMTGGEGYDFYYASDSDRQAQVRTPIIDTAHGEHWVFRVKDIGAWWTSTHHERPGGVRSQAPTGWRPGLKPVRFMEIGCPAVRFGANGPNVFHDPKSSESAFPPFSDGTRDDLQQRATLKALIEYLDPGSGGLPVSPVDGSPLVAPEHVYGQLGAWALAEWPGRICRRGRCGGRGFLCGGAFACDRRRSARCGRLCGGRPAKGVRCRGPAPERAGP